MKRIKSVTVLVCLAALCLVSCKKETEVSESTFTVFTETYENTIEISGNIAAADQQKMKASSSGTIEQIYFKEGDYVKKGDVICKMSDLEQQYNIANLKYQIAQKKLNASPREVELLEMQLKVKQQELEDKKCIARFDGIIAKLNIHEGDYLEAQDEIATIINRNYLKATVEIAETDVSKLALNQKVTFTFPAYPEKLEGYVAYYPAVGTVTSRGSTVVEAEIRIENPPEEILTGFSFTGTIEITAPKTLTLVSKDALGFENKQTIVKRVRKDGSEETVEIEFEMYGDKYINILDGVSEGDVLKNLAGERRSGMNKDAPTFKKTSSSDDEGSGGFGGMPGGGMPGGGMPGGGMPSGGMPSGGGGGRPF